MTKGLVSSFDMVEATFNRLYRVFEHTLLAKQTYVALPMGPAQKRPEDIHLILEDINLAEMTDVDWLLKKVTPLAHQLSYKIFSQGKPLGFWNLGLPGGVEFKIIHQMRDPARGFTFRALMQYELTRGAHVFAFGARPEYNEEVIAQMKSAGLTR